ncbi:MAG: VCBS repeat-containing protein [Acidobacteriota bacterium]
MNRFLERMTVLSFLARPSAAPPRQARPRVWLLSLLCLVIPAAAGAQIDFVAGWELDEGASSWGLDLADVDVDGDLDLYISDREAPDSLWINDGAGNFTHAAVDGDAGRGSGVALDDLNGDGFPDLVLSRHLATNLVAFGTGGTFFAAPTFYGISDSRRRVTTVDINLDGDLDIIVPVDGSLSGFELYSNDGVGTFTLRPPQSTTSWVRAVAAGDLAGDAKPELVLATNGWNEIWKRQGASFVDTGIRVGSHSSFDATIEDFDGDGDLDIFIANGYQQGTEDELWLRDGNTFVESSQQFASDYSFAVASGDLDGDGDADLVVGTNGGQPSRVWLNDGSGTFTDAGIDLGDGTTLDVGLADIDGDGDLDILMANGGQPDLVHLNDGAGGFTDSGQRLGSNSASSMAMADLDGDGDEDLAMGDADGIVRIFDGDGAGSFAEAGPWLNFGFANVVTEIALADVDGDGDRDLVAATTGSLGDKATRIWTNNGAGVFTDSGLRLLPGTNTNALAVGDVDGDGDLDLALGTYGTYGTVDDHVLLNDGSLGFTEVLVGSGSTTAMTFGDVDGDGDLDLVIGRNGDHDEVWLGDGVGGFVDSGQTLDAGDARSLALADVDGDGDLDLYVGNNGANTVWLNDGSGAFLDSGQSLGLFETADVDFADFDGDGDLDVWASETSISGRGNRVWVNDGTGTFTDRGSLFGTSSSSDSAVADLDGDGLLDVVVGNHGGDHRVWLGQP